MDENLKAQKREKTQKLKKTQKQKKTRYLFNPEIASFAGQMGLVLKAGISGIEGITIMRDDTEDEGDRKLLSEILDAAEESGRLAPALESVGVFPPYMCRMVRIGEETGNLDTVMASLEQYYENEEDIRRDTTNSIMYPLLLTAIMIVVVIVLMVEVMPVFDQVFHELGTEMTGFPLLMMNIGRVIRTYSVSVLMIVGSVVLIIFVSRLTPEGIRFWHNFGYHFKSIRKGYEETAAYRFASVMSMALSSGLTPEQGLELASGLNDDEQYEKKLEEVKNEVAAGGELADSLQKQKIFSGICARMASLGSKTGTLDQVLAQIAELYKNEADDRLNRRLASVEPTLVIILSVLIGAILLSVMFPLLGIMSSL